VLLETHGPNCLGPTCWVCAALREARRAQAMDERAALAAVGWANSMGKFGALQAELARLQRCGGCRADLGDTPLCFDCAGGHDD